MGAGDHIELREVIALHQEVESWPGANVRAKVELTEA
jgi:hypothetical protein